VAALGGYTLAAFGPGWAGMDASLTASGTIATVSGLILAVAALARARAAPGALAKT